MFCVDIHDIFVCACIAELVIGLPELVDGVGELAAALILFDEEPYEFCPNPCYRMNRKKTLNQLVE